MNKALWLLVSALACAILLSATLPTAASRAADQRMIELILDASGSMAGKLPSGELKIDAAKKAVAQLAEKLPGETLLAFRAYGHQSPREKHDCTDTQLLVGFGPLSQGKGKIIADNQSVLARGYTPITYVLQKAAEDFPQDFPGERMIILVSDGKETCEGDPCAAALALAKSKARLVIHTVGFGVDESTRAQLDCIARATGGRYFGATDTAQLVAGLSEAVRTSATMVVEKKGPGWLTMKYADLSGHEVTNAETGEKVATISSLGSTVKLPAGIYNVTVGQSVWKSVVVKAGETTFLDPGLLEMKKASLDGHDVLDRETGAVQGRVSSLQNTATLIPGEYQIMFGKLPWDVLIRAGEKTIMNPGTVEVRRAHYTGHKIFTKRGDFVGEVSNIQDTIPLPPGDYVIEIDEQKIPFTLKEGEDLKFERKT
jgi:hypothetical protein